MKEMKSREQQENVPARKFLVRSGPLERKEQLLFLANL